MEGAVLSGIRAVGIDLDGVVYLGGRQVAGADSAIATLRRNGIKVLALTNNSARTRTEIAAKLQAMGVVCAEDEILTSAMTTAAYLGNAGVDEVAVVGSPSLCVELETAGIQVVSDGTAKALVVGYKPDFSYADVERGARILDGGARFVACNLERRFPGDDGVLRPGCGPGVMAIAHAAGRQPDGVAGKPSLHFMNAALRLAGVPVEAFAMVGDSLESDVAMARDAGCMAVYIRGPASAQKTDPVGVAAFDSLRDWVNGLTDLS